MLTGTVPMSLPMSLGTEQTTALALGEINEGEVTRTDHKVVQILTTSDPTKIQVPNNMLEKVTINGNKKAK